MDGPLVLLSVMIAAAAILWMITGWLRYRLTQQPRYSVNITQEGERWRTVVRCNDGHTSERTGPDYGKAVEFAVKEIKEYNDRKKKSK